MSLEAAVRVEGSPPFNYRLMAVGLLILQLTWVILLPPFRGSDEFDHAYRASAVAHGQIVATVERATRGTGAWVTPSRDIVEAAQAECKRLEYTTRADCVPRAGSRGDRVTIASGAGRYNPSYYLMVGWASLPFDGAAALLAMRIVTVLISCALFYLALLSLGGVSVSRWPAIGVLLAATPVAVYSTAVVAPNGVEIMAGLATWAALQAGLRATAGWGSRTALATFTVGAVLLCVLRQLGPLWLVLILGISFVATPRRYAAARRLAGDTLSRAMLGLVILAGCFGAWWTVANQSLTIGIVEPERVLGTAEIASKLPERNFLWMLQSIAAFPLRDEPAPTLVYVCLGLLWLGLVLVGLRLANWPTRLSGLLAIAAMMAIPTYISLSTVNEFGWAWQGRYGLPFSIGIVVLASLCIDGRLSGLLTGRVLWPCFALLLAGQVTGAVNVLLAELENSPQVGTGNWLEPSPLIVGLVATLGLALMWSGATREPALLDKQVRDVEHDRV